jgi:hypothetical protein
MRQHSGWHVPDDDLSRYVGLGVTPPLLWSIEAHLVACPTCRTRLAELADTEDIEAGWASLDAALDAPVPGPVERVLIAVGVPDHTARLLAATPALRLSWLVAVALTATVAALLAGIGQPIVLLATAPLLPLIGVAASYGRGIDPTYEVALVAPLHSFRLLLLRCVAVLSVNTVLYGAASLAQPDLGLAAVGWFLPSLALTVIVLLLMPRLGPVTAAATVAFAWVALVVSLADIVLTSTGQLAVAATAVVAAVVLSQQIPAFDTSRFRHPRMARRF